MGKEKTTIQKLREFAEKSHRKINFNEKYFPSNALHPVTYHRRFLYIPESSYACTIFACFGDTRRIDKTSIFSGVFFPVEVSESTKVCVRKKDVLDKMHLFGKKKRYKTGSESFDNKVVFEEFTGIGTNIIFKNSEVQDIILKTFDFDMKLRIGINMLNLDFIPELQGHSHMGIYSTQQWHTDSSEIEILYDLAEQIKRQTVVKAEKEAVLQF